MDEKNERIFALIKLFLSGLLLVLSFTLSVGELAALFLRLSAAIISGYEILYNSVTNLLKREFFDENTLMLIASVTAFIIGESFEGVIILLLYNFGEMLEDVATDNSRDKIAGLAELKSTKAYLWSGGKAIETDPQNVPSGSLILVKKGDRVPIDGTLISEKADFDLKAVTGESRIYGIEKGGNIYGGSINLCDAVVLKTDKLYKDSTVEKIIAMVEESTERKAKSQKFITAFAKVYTPCVVFFALLLATVPPAFLGYDFEKWIYKALSFLIISCPCALVISVPLGFFIGIGALAKRGVLVKGSNYIDALSKTKIAVFDKTGTLTTGEFSVGKITAHNGYSDSEILKIAASLESFSNHPIANALKRAAGENIFKATDIHETAGRGVSGVIDGIKYSVGGAGILNGSDKDLVSESDGISVVYVKKTGVLIGEIELTDGLKESGNELVEKLRKVGVDRIIILSGDKKSVVDKVARELETDSAYSELLPEQKTEKIKEIMSENKKGGLLYCGDGINDSPSIALSDVGVAMGALGSETAIDCADVIIADDNLLKIPYAIKKSRLIRRKVLTNIIVSVSVKIAIMALSVFTPLPIWIAMFADVGVMLLAVLNSLTIGLYR